VEVKDGKAYISLPPGKSRLRFVSSLPPSEKVELTAPQNGPYLHWVLNASPIWHVDPAGLTVIHYKDRQDRWQPQWRPWPGETVTLNVTRPEATPGRTVTIESADLKFTPGLRFNDAELTLTARASEGGRHELTLPEGAKVQQVKINGRNQPVSDGGEKLQIPLTPGQQDVYVQWRSPADGRTILQGPQVEVGDQAVNARVVFHMPRDRWILFTSGPDMGPAVLFWTYLAVVVLAAVALSLTGLTPLKPWQWLLLGLGLTQVHPIMAIVIVGWLIALDVRGRLSPPENWAVYDLVQIGLAVLTVFALGGLYVAVEQGLLGAPEMQIAGAGSTDFRLIWRQDRIEGFMPQPWVFSLPRLAFHLLMLAWALWLAWSLIKWLRWGWSSFSFNGPWRRPRLRRKDQTQEEDFLIE
jgi:hypothetical protein